MHDGRQDRDAATEALRGALERLCEDGEPAAVLPSLHAYVEVARRRGLLPKQLAGEFRMLYDDVCRRRGPDPRRQLQRERFVLTIARAYMAGVRPDTEDNPPSR